MSISRKFRNLIGLSGVSPRETVSTRRIGALFEWLMLALAFWLPFSWYFTHVHLLSYRALWITDWIVWMAFLSETVVLLLLVRHPWYYLRTNWMNLVMIIVACPLVWIKVPILGAARVIRVLVLLRVTLPFVTTIKDVLSANRLGMTLLIVLLTTCLMGVLISSFDSGIADPMTGIWWAFETVTTVGYGDIVPSTPLGKLMAVVVMLMGVTLFSVLTASLSAYFIGNTKADEILKALKKLEEKIEAIEKSNE